MHLATCACDNAAADALVGKQDWTSYPYQKQLCNKFFDVFADRQDPPDRRITHDIELHDENGLPPKPRMYRMSPAKLDEVKRQLEGYLEKGWIRSSTLPYGAPILFVRKSEGTLRMCIDYRALNK